MFEFANSEITGVTTYFLNCHCVKENVPFLESRFSNCSAFKGTRKNGEFFPGGENIVMNCVSVLPKIYVPNKKKLFYLSSISWLDYFMLVLMMVVLWYYDVL